MTVVSEADASEWGTEDATLAPVLEAVEPNVRVQEGDDAILKLTVSSGSDLPLNIHWTRGGGESLDGDRFVADSGGGGVLRIRGARRSDSGPYRARAVVGGGGDCPHVDYELDVYPAAGDVPAFLRRLTDLAVKVGTRTRLLVEIRSATQVKTAWLRQGKEVVPDERLHFLNEGSFFCLDVAPVTLEDSGEWAVIAQNVEGRATCSCFLNVLVPKAYKKPVFVEQLRAVLTAASGTVSLECKVIGVPTPQLKWFKDGAEIRAGDVFALSADPADPTTLGTYTCEATNCMGKATSSSRVHVVPAAADGSHPHHNSLIPSGPVPKFKDNLKDQKVKIGGSLLLENKVEVPPWPENISWFNAQGLVEEGGRYHIMADGLGGYSVSVNPVEAIDQGQWKCVATSNLGLKSITACNVAMTFPKNYRAPRFLEALRAVLTEEGLVSFECKVVGFPTPQLQWFKDGQELKPGDVYQLTGSNSLGSYCCIARNCMGEARSTAELTVEDIQNQLTEEEKIQLAAINRPPQFQVGLKSCQAEINQPFRFTVQVTVNPEPVVTWFRDDEELQGSENYSFLKEAHGFCHLSIQRLELIDQAEWKCVATNDYGQSVTSCFLKLNIPRHFKKPRFLECLRAVLSEEGAVNLECKVIGVPQPVLKWYKDGKELCPGDIHKIISGEDGTCCLGVYTCEAHNCMGTVSSSASLLGFEQKPQEKASEQAASALALTRQPSLSTIQEERSSQMHSITIDDRQEVSFSFDGKEVSVSLYETPDLTEEEALQVVEMYAEELSEHVSEHNVVELPPMRFVKETSTSGHILMEAVVIDVSPDFYASAEDDLRTDADLEEFSISEEAYLQNANLSMQDDLPFDKINSDFLERALSGSLSYDDVERRISPAKPKRKSRDSSSASESKKKHLDDDSSGPYSDALASEKESKSQKDSFVSAIESPDRDMNVVKVFETETAKSSSVNVEKTVETIKRTLDEPVSMQEKKKKRSKSRSVSKERNVEEKVATATIPRRSLSKDKESPKEKSSDESSKNDSNRVKKIQKHSRRKSKTVDSEAEDDSLQEFERRKVLESSMKIEVESDQMTSPETQKRDKVKSTDSEREDDSLIEFETRKSISLKEQLAEKRKNKEHSLKRGAKKRGSTDSSGKEDDSLVEYERRKNLSVAADDKSAGSSSKLTRAKKGSLTKKGSSESSGKEDEAQKGDTEKKRKKKSTKQTTTTVQTKELTPETGVEVIQSSETDSVGKAIEMRRGREAPSDVDSIKTSRDGDDETAEFDTAEDSAYDRSEMSVLESLTQSLQEMQRGLAVVGEQIKSSSSEEPESAKSSLSVLESLAQPINDIKKGIRTVEKQIMNDSQTGDYSPSKANITILETIAQPVQELQRTLALVEQKSSLEGDEDTSILERTSQSILETVAQPLQEFNREMALIQQQAVLDVTDDSFETIQSFKPQLIEVQGGVLQSEKDLSSRVEELSEITMDTQSTYAQSVQELQKGLAQIVERHVYDSDKKSNDDLLPLTVKDIQDDLLENENFIRELKEFEIRIMKDSEVYFDRMDSCMQNINSKIAKAEDEEMRDLLNSVRQMIAPLNSLQSITSKCIENVAENPSCLQWDVRLSKDNIMHSLTRPFEVLDGTIDILGKVADCDSDKETRRICTASLYKLTVPMDELKTTVKLVENLSPQTAIEFLLPPVDNMLSAISGVNLELIRPEFVDNVVVDGGNVLKGLDDSLDIMINCINSIEKYSSEMQSSHKEENITSLSTLTKPLEDLQNNLHSLEKFIVDESQLDNLNDSSQLYHLVQELGKPLQNIRIELSIIKHQIELEEYSSFTLQPSAIIRDGNTRMFQLLEPVENMQKNVTCFHEAVLSKSPDEPLHLRYVLYALSTLTQPMNILCSTIMKTEEQLLQEIPSVSDPSVGLRIVTQSVSELRQSIESIKHQSHEILLQPELLIISDILSTLSSPLLEVEAGLGSLSDQVYDEDKTALNINLLKTMAEPFKALQKALIEISNELSSENISEAVVFELKQPVQELQRSILVIQDQVSFEYGDEPTTIESNIVTLQSLIQPMKTLKRHFINVQKVIAEQNKSVDIQLAQKLIDISKVMHKLQLKVSSMMVQQSYFRVSKHSGRLELFPILQHLVQFISDFERAQQITVQHIERKHKLDVVKLKEKILNNMQYLKMDMLNLHKKLNSLKDLSPSDGNSTEILTKAIHEFTNALMDECAMLAEETPEEGSALACLQDHFESFVEHINILHSKLLSIEAVSSDKEDKEKMKQRITFQDQSPQKVKILDLSLNALQGKLLSMMNVVEHNLQNESAGLSVQIIENMMSCTNAMKENITSLKMETKLTDLKEADETCNRAVEELRDCMALLTSEMNNVSDMFSESSVRSLSATVENITACQVDISKKLEDIMLSVEERDKAPQLDEYTDQIPKKDEIMGSINIVNENIKQKLVKISDADSSHRKIILSEPVQCLTAQLSDLSTNIFSSDIKSEALSESQVKENLKIMADINSSLLKLEDDVKKEESITTEIKEKVIASVKNLQKAVTSITEDVKENQTISAFDQIIEPLNDFNETIVGHDDNIKPKLSPLRAVMGEEYNEAETLKETSFRILEEFARASSELEFGLMKVEHNLLNISEMKKGNIVTVVEPLVQPIQQLCEKVAMVEEILLDPTVEEHMSSLSMLKTLAEPIRDIQRNIVQIQEHCMESTGKRESGEKVLQVIAKPIRELRSGVALIQEQAMVMEADALTISESLSSSETLAKPLEELKQVLTSIVNQQAMVYEPGTESMSEAISELKTIAEPVRQLQKQLAAIETQQLLDGGTVGSGSVKEAIATVAKPVTELRYAIATIENQIALESTDSIESDKYALIIALEKSLYEVSKGIACINEQQVLEDVVSNSTLSDVPTMASPVESPLLTGTGLEIHELTVLDGSSLLVGDEKQKGKIVEEAAGLSATSVEQKVMKSDKPSSEDIVADQKQLKTDKSTSESIVIVAGKKGQKSVESKSESMVEDEKEQKSDKSAPEDVEENLSEKKVLIGETKTPTETQQLVTLESGEPLPKLELRKETAVSKTVTVEQGLATKTENQVFESCTSTSREETINKEQAAVKESSLRELATVEEQKSLSQVESFDVSQREADSNATLTQSGIEVVVKEEQKSLQPLETLESLKSTTHAQQVVSCLNVAEKTSNQSFKKMSRRCRRDSLSSSAVAIERDASVKSGTAVVKITETKVETCKGKEAKVEDKVKEKQSSESSVSSDKLQEVKETSKMESQSSSKDFEISENRKHITESVKEKTSEPTIEETDSVIVEKESEKEKEVENANLGRFVEGELESAKSKLDEVRKILSADKKVKKDEENVESEDKNEKKDEIIVDEKQSIKSDENSKIETEKTVEVKEEKVKKEAEVQRKKVEDGSEREGKVVMETDRKLDEGKKSHEEEKKTEEVGDRTEKKIEEKSKDGSKKTVIKEEISDEAEKEEEKERKAEQVDSGIEAETKEKPGEGEGKQENSMVKSEKKPQVEEIKVENKDQTRKSENEAAKAGEEKQKQRVEAQKKDESEAKNKEAVDQKKKKEIEIRESENEELLKVGRDSSIKTVEEKVDLESETKKTAGKENVEVVDITKSKTQEKKMEDEKSEEEEAKAMKETGVKRGKIEEGKKKAEDDKKAETEKMKLETDNTTEEKDTKKSEADAKKIEVENKILGEETKKKTDQEVEKKGETDFETKKKEEKKELEKVVEKTVEAHKELEKKNKKKTAEEKNELDAEAKQKAEEEKEKLDVETNKKDELERPKLKAEDKKKTETSEKKLEEETKKDTGEEKKKLDEKYKKMAEEEKPKLKHESNKESEEENEKLEMETKKKAEEEKRKVEEEKKKKTEEGKNKLESDAKKNSEEGKKLEESKKKSEEEKKKRDGDVKRKEEEEEEKKIEEEAKKISEEEKERFEKKVKKDSEEEKKKFEDKDKKNAEEEKKILETDNKKKAEEEKKKLENEKKKKEEEEKKKLEAEAKKKAEEEKEKLEEENKKKVEEDKKKIEAVVKKKAEEEKKKLEEENKKKAEEEKNKLEAEAKKKAEGEKEKLEENNKKKAEEEKKKLEAEAKKKAEEEKKKLEDENRKKAEEEKNKLEAEAKKKAVEEKKKLGDENKKKAEEEKMKLEAEAKKKAEEERKKLEEESKKKAEEEKNKLEAEAKKKAVEEKKKLEDKNKKKAEEEKMKLEAEAKKKAEEERKKLEEENKKKAEEEKNKLEAEAKKKAEEERKKLEDKNKKKAEEEKMKLEAEAKKKAEEERRKLEEENKKKSEEEKKKLEAEAKKKAEEEKRKLEEENKKKAEEEKMKLEAEAKNKAEEEKKKKKRRNWRRKQEEIGRREKEARKAEAKKKAEEERRKLEEENKKKSEEEKKKLEAEAKKKAEEEKRKLEEENKKKAEEEKMKLEAEAKNKAEEERKKLEEENKKKSEEEKKKLEAEAKKKAEEEKKKLEEENKKKAEEEKKKLEAEAKKKAEEERKKLEEENKKKSEEEKKKLEAEAKKKAEEEKKKLEEENKKKAEVEKMKLEAEAKKKVEEERKKLEEENKKKAEEEKKKLEAEAKKKAEEEKKKLEEENKKKAEVEKMKLEAEAKKKVEEERKKLEEENKKKAEEEKKKLEAEAKKKAEEEKKKLEVENKKKAEEEKKKLEAEAKKKAEKEKKNLEEENKKKAEEEKKKLEAEAKKKEEEERKKLEEENKKKAEEERKKLEEENKKKAEEEKKKLEAEVKKKAEEEKKKLEEGNKKKEEEEKKKLEAEAKMLAEEKKKLEAEANKKADEEQKKLEEENKKKAEEEKTKLEKEKKKKAEEEKMKLKEENKKKAEDEKKKLEAEVKKKAEEEKMKLEEENKKKAEEEKKILQAETKKKTEEEKKKLEVETKKKAEEGKKKLEEGNKKEAVEEKSKLKKQKKNRAEEENKKLEEENKKKLEEEKKKLETDAKLKAENDKKNKEAKAINYTEKEKNNFGDETIDTNKVENKNEKIETSVETDRGSQKKQDNLKQKSRVKVDKTQESIELKNEKDGERKKGPKSEESEVTEVIANTMEKRGSENESFIDGISYEKSDKYSNVQLFIEEEINRETSKYDGAADRKIRSKSQESAFWISTTSEPKYKRDDSFASKPSEASPRQSWAKRETKTKPYFCGRLMDRTAAQESRVKMSCSFIGNPEPTVAWLKDGLPLLHGASDPLAGRCETKVSNGVATIEIYSASPSDCGRYSCVVSSDLGQATTTATLRIFEKFEPTPSPPSFTRRIQDKYDFRADELTLECKVQGQPRPTITWRKDDKALPARGRYQQSDSIDGTCRLVISGPEPQDSGVYTCHAENAVWNEQISDVVTFEGRASYAESARKETTNRIDYRKPFIANLLGDHTVPAGGTLALHVQLKEKSAGSQVTWYRGTEPLSRLNTRAKYFKEDDTYSLVLPEVKPQEAGLYMCRVSNAYGHSDTCANVQIITFGSHTQARGGKPAMFTRRPDTTLHIVSGEDVSVSFRLSGDPKPKVTWMKGLKDMTSNARSMKETIDDCTRLTLKRATIYDSGTYFIVAKNTYGCDRAFFTVQVRQRSRSLTPISNYGVLDTQTILRDIHEMSQASLQDVPGAISSEPEIADSGRTWMTITWGKPTHRGAAPILAYKVEAWQVGEHGGARWSELGVTPMNSFDAFDLTPGAAYRFRVTARNRYGWGEPVVTREPLTVVVCDQRAPEIVTDLPGSFKALVDTNLTLQCEVRGDPPPDIRWFHDGKEVAMARRACDRLLVSRRDSVCSLLIRDLQPRDSGRYVCEAASKLGRASTFARLLVVHDAKLLKAADRLRRVQEDDLTTLDSPPQFSLRLRDRRIEVSYPIRLTCQVVGFPAPNITWLKDGSEIKSDEHFRFCSEQGFVTLEISRSRMEDAGEYTAEARNEHGSVACTCRLVVDRGIKDYIAPAFLADIERQATVREGATLRLRATVEAYPSVDIMWHRDGTRLRQSRRLTCTLDKEGHVEFTLADVTSRDAGTYTCTATNEVGRCECVCQVTVTPRLTSVPTSSADVNNQIAENALPYSQVPMFTMKPRSTDAVEGDTVILMCEVVGDPEPEIFCLRDGLKPDYYHHGPGFVSHREGHRYRLEIPQARLDYTGAYAIIARNQHGEARAVVSLQIYARGQGKEGTMSSGEVKQGKVQTLPEVRKELKDMRCCDGDSVTLECQVYATPPPDIRWLKDGKILALGGDVSSDVDGEVARLTISKVYPEDEGEYTCMAYNELGRALTSACLIVDVPEEKETMVTKQLSKPPGFLSTHSTPRTTPTRSISPGVQAVTRDFATPLNRPQRKRTKFSSPKFYAVPHNKVAQEGDTVKLQCSAAGHPNPWSSWDKDGHIVTPSARLTLLEQDDMRILQIKEVTPEDAGLYRVTLENDYGSVEATARLEVIAHKGTKTKGVRAWSASRASPTFGRRLVGSAARVGGNFTLACDVQASPSPNITWYRNTEVVVKSDRIHPLWDGRCARLKLTSLEREDAGVYTCVAENELGTTRCSAELLVLAEDDPSDADLRPPVFLTGLPATTNIPEGQPAELQVKLQGTQPLEVVWSKDKVELPDCMDFRYVDYGDGRFGLRIADAFPADAGHYSCEAFNKHGDAITYGHLQVTEQCESTDSTKKQLYFSKTPIPLEAEPGQSACFCARVHSAANTQVNIDWSVAGQPTSQQPQRFKVERDGDSTVLRIATVQADDMGPISCRAHICLAGHTAPVAACAKCYVTSCTSRLSAVPTAEGWPAQLLHGPADTTALRGQRVILQAAYSGCPQPTVRWLKAGRELSNDAYMTIINEDGLSSLILDPVSADDSGKYVVSVENSHGADCHFASVAVEGPPDPPAGRPSVRTLNSTATIAWSSPPYDGGCMVTGYRVEMKKLPQTSWTVVTDRCHSLSHTVHDLVPGIDYVFRVRAENVHGASEASVETPIISIGSKASSGSDEEEVAVEPRTWERVQVEPGHVFSSRYEIMEELGKGRYGVVHKVLDKLSNNKMAAKFVRCIKKQDKQKVLEEIDIMNCLRHPKLLQLVSAYDNTREIVMVTEYITGGELFERVVADDFTLTERDCMLFMRQICEGVDYMHQNSVVHLDLKPENIMCYTRTSHQIKIIDFGLAQKLSPNITLRVLFGTPEFIPPEIINYEPIGVESDMWSIGVICYVLLSGLSPFMGDNDAETFANITRADYDFDDEAFDAISPDVKHLISNLLVKRKEKRFSARQCLEHKWMSQCDKTMSCVKLSTDKLKKFIIRRKWQKTGNAIRALGRMATLSAASRRNSATSSQSSSPRQSLAGGGVSRMSSLNEEEQHNHVTTSQQIHQISAECNGSNSRVRVCSERSDSGISDCSSINAPTTQPHQLTDKVFSILEENELCDTIANTQIKHTRFLNDAETRTNSEKSFPEEPCDSGATVKSKQTRFQNDDKTTTYSDKSFPKIPGEFSSDIVKSRQTRFQNDETARTNSIKSTPEILDDEKMSCDSVKTKQSRFHNDDKTKTNPDNLSPKISKENRLYCDTVESKQSRLLNDNKTSSTNSDKSPSKFAEKTSDSVTFRSKQTRTDSEKSSPKILEGNKLSSDSGTVVRSKQSRFLNDDKTMVHPDKKSPPKARFETSPKQHHFKEATKTRFADNLKPSIDDTSFKGTLGRKAGDVENNKRNVSRVGGIVSTNKRLDDRESVKSSSRSPSAGKNSVSSTNDDLLSNRVSSSPFLNNSLNESGPTPDDSKCVHDVSGGGSPLEAGGLRVADAATRRSVSPALQADAKVLEKNDNFQKAFAFWKR
ncbi:LOW QUALITY PROTEIN: muscle M-line assembly protein unc-89 [Nilaparvata lugens]|nr:LOW QUALITY PROTEIN: muscle M-line assembly protein unc-89 [Nilaparvata lugens]